MCRRDSSVSNVAVLCYLSKVATERSFVQAAMYALANAPLER
jgi:hypothetical protein